MTTLDLSIYDYSTFAPSCFAANGVERVIIGTSNLAASRDMIVGCRAAGIAVEDLYGFIYYGLSYESRDLDNCLALAAELGGITRIWLDCESGFSDNGVEDDTEAPWVTVEDRFLATMDQRRRVEAAGLQAGIYTGIYWWRSKMADSHAFADLPMWLAYYGANDGQQQPITELGIFSFGGWTKTAAHQFASTIGLCGRANRDHNYWFIPDSEEDSPMTKTERGLLNIAWGDFGRAYDCYVVLRGPGSTDAIRGLLPDEGIESAFANGCADDDLNAAMVMRGRLTTILTSDVADDAARILKVIQ